MKVIGTTNLHIQSFDVTNKKHVCIENIRRTTKHHYKVHGSVRNGKFRDIYVKDPLIKKKNLSLNDDCSFSNINFILSQYVWIFLL